jgi:hypothetical protein
MKPFGLQRGDEASVDEVFDFQLTRLGDGGGELFERRRRFLKPWPCLGRLFDLSCHRNQ